MRALQGGQRRILAVLSYHSPLYFLETWCLTEPRATLAGQKVPVVLLSLLLIALWLKAFIVILMSTGDLNSVRHD